MKRFFWGAVAGILLLIALSLGFLLSGAFNIGATAGSGTLETTLANWTVNRSVSVRAPQELNPLHDDPQALAAGLAHYKTSCVHCHGAPALDPSEFAAGLNPPAPALDEAARRWSDGELFWLTKHGIRMTGMPAFSSTHSDDELWQTVAFVRHIGNLSESELAELRSARIEGAHEDKVTEPAETAEVAAAEQPTKDR